MRRNTAGIVLMERDSVVCLLRLHFLPNISAWERLVIHRIKVIPRKQNKTKQNKSFNDLVILISIVVKKDKR